MRNRGVFFRRLACLAGMAAFGAAGAVACEPVLPMMYVLNGGVILIPALMTLAVAIGVKCIVFALSEKTLTPWRALAFMFIANIVSSIIGVLFNVGLVDPSLFMFMLPVMVILAWIPSQRAQILANYLKAGRWSRNATAVFIVVGVVGSVVFFTMAQDVLYDIANAGAPAQDDIVGYWVLKFGYLFVAVLVSILLTTIWEEWVLASLAQSRDEHHFYASALRANLITFLVIMGWAAWMMVPKRHAAQGFLALLDSMGFGHGVVL